MFWRSLEPDIGLMEWVEPPETEANMDAPQITVWVLAAASVLIWLAALLDISKRGNSDFEGVPLGSSRSTWLFSVVVTGGVGGLIYFAIARPKMPPRPAGRPAD